MNVQIPERISVVLKEASHVSDRVMLIDLYQIRFVILEVEAKVCRGTSGLSAFDHKALGEIEIGSRRPCNITLGPCPLRRFPPDTLAKLRPPGKLAKAREEFLLFIGTRSNPEACAIRYLTELAMI
jgi:hypothetical protein